MEDDYSQFLDLDINSIFSRPLPGKYAHLKKAYKVRGGTQLMADFRKFVLTNYIHGKSRKMSASWTFLIEKCPHFSPKNVHNF